MPNPVHIFDRKLLRQRRIKAARNMPDAAFLYHEVAGRLLERMHDINRSFDWALALGWDAQECPLPAKSPIYADLAEERSSPMPGPSLACDEEFLPIADKTMDLITSNLSLHWVNDLPGALIQINRALKPDGLFLGAMLGGETLIELREVLSEAEAEVTGGLSPRISPMAEIRDMGGLLQRAGFAMPVVDAETITISYETPLALMRDLRLMGETNAVSERRKSFSSRALFLRAAELYADRYRDEDGRILASFQVLFLCAWAPGPGQPKPKQPGSATARLADALKVSEITVKGSRSH